MYVQRSTAEAELLNLESLHDLKSQVSRQGKSGANVSLDVPFNEQSMLSDDVARFSTVSRTVDWLILVPINTVHLYDSYDSHICVELR